MGIFKGSQDPEKLAKKEAAKAELKAMSSQLMGKAKTELSRQIDDAKNPGTAFCEGASKNKMYAALIKAGAELKYSIVHSEASSGIIVFQTHDAEKHWDGTLSCSIQESDGGSTFVINGRAEQGITKSGKYELGLFAMTTGFPGSISQAASEGGVASHQAKLKKKVLKVVKEISEPAEQGNTRKKEGGDSLGDNIAQLNELYNSGVLSKAEFQAAKKKLLS